VNFPDRAALERIRDWNEFNLHLDEKKFRRGRALHGLRGSLLPTGKLIAALESGSAR